MSETRRRRRIFPWQKPQEDTGWDALSFKEKEQKLFEALAKQNYEGFESREEAESRYKDLTRSFQTLAAARDKLFDMRTMLDTLPPERSIVFAQDLSKIEQDASFCHRDAGMSLEKLNQIYDKADLGPFFDGDPQDGATVLDCAAAYMKETQGRTPVSLAVGREIDRAAEPKPWMEIQEGDASKNPGFTPRKIKKVDETILKYLPTGNLRSAAFDTLRENGLGRSLYAVAEPDAKGSVMICDTPDYNGRACTMVPESMLVYEDEKDKEPVIRVRKDEPVKDPAAGARVVAQMEAIGEPKPASIDFQPED